MKSSTYKKISLFLVMSLFIFASCRKTVTIKTILDNNGSLQRIVSISGDSTGVGATTYPFPQDGSWDMVTHKDSANSYTYIIRKNFADVAALNNEIIYREDSLQFDALATLDKSFRWFYTYYRYEETFFKVFPFTGADISDYVTKEEIARYQAGDDSSGIDDKIEEYAAQSMFNEFYNAFVAAVIKSSLTIQKTTLDQKKDELFEKLDEWDVEDDEDDFGHYFLRISDRVYSPEKSFTILAPALREKSAKFNAYLEMIFDGFPSEEYRFTVVGPGHIIDTNASSGVNDQEASWEFSDEHFHHFDYVMWVESRRLNVVPTLITALFVFAGLFLLWLSARRSRRQKLEAHGIAWEDRKRMILPWWLSSLFIVLGLALAGWFGWIFLVFQNDPLLQLLKVFGARPQNNWSLLCIAAVGIIVSLWGIYQLLVYRKMKKRAR